MRKLLVIVLLSAACFAQSFSTSGQFSATGQLLAPAPSTPPTILPAIGFGMHVHNPTVIQPTFPFDAYRIWGTSCQWDTIETAAATFNWSCIDQWIAFANTNNVDLIFTFGQLPLFLSTINPDAGNSPFPVPNNGITIACVGGGCTATVTTLQRLNAALGDTLVIASDDGSCPESLTATGGATSVNNQTDYPWTYSFPIAGGTTNSTGCGGAAITLTDTSLTATRCNGTGNPPSGQAGGCYSTADVGVDGTGNDCEFNRNSGACTGHSGFLVAFLNHLASSDPNHKFKYFEMWNEPQGAGFFNGSIAQMARMQKDAYTLIQGSSRSDIILTSPAPSGGLTSPATYLSQFCADPSQPGQYVQQWHVHTYNFPSGAAAPKPEDAMTIATNVKNVLASCPFAAGKPLWASEGSWGQGQWALNGSIGPNTGTTVIADKAGWAFNSYAFHQCAGFGRFYWFALDQQCNTGLACTSPNSNQPAAYAYGLAHDIFTGSSISQTCSQDAAKNWTLGLSRAGGYSAQIVWNENLTVPGTFTIPTGTWTRYRDVTGAIHSITGLQTSVPTNYDPIILENQAPPLSITTVTLPAGIAGSAFSATLTANCPNVPCTYAERSLPSVLTANHLALNSSTGAITGTPLAAFSGSVIITIKDALGQTNNSILGLTVTSSAPLIITNSNPPAGQTSAAYSFTFTASGGVGAHTWALASGAFPTGLSLNASTGVLSGMPSVAATFTFAVSATDTLSTVVTSPTYTVIITATAGSGFACVGSNCAQLPQAWVNNKEFYANEASPDVTKVITSDSLGDYPWTCAGIQSAITAWAAAADQAWDVKIDPGIIPAATANCFLLKYKSGATKFLVLESSNPPTRGQTICSHQTKDNPDGSSPRNLGCTNDIANLWQISTSSGSFRVIDVDESSGNGPQLIALRDFAASFSTSLTTTQALVGLGNSSETTVAQTPQHVHIENAYLHGDSADTGNPVGNNLIPNDLIMSCRSCSFMYSQIDKSIRAGGEGHAIWVQNSPGPVKIDDNWIEGQSIGIFMGGGVPNIPGNLAAYDVEIRRNRLTFPSSWLLVGTWTNGSVGRKNGSETKESQRVLWDGNIVENVDNSGGQVAPCFSVAVRASSAGAQVNNYVATTTDYTITNNVFRHCLGTQDDAQSGGNNSGIVVGLGGQKLNYWNNLIYDQDATKYCGPTGGGPCSPVRAPGFSSGSYTWGTANDNHCTGTGCTGNSSSCSAVRDALGVVTLTCTAPSPNSTGLAQTNINIGDPVRVQNCSDATFNAGTSTIDSPALAGTLPAGLVVVYQSSTHSAGTATACTLTNGEGWWKGIIWSHNSVVAAPNTTNADFAYQNTQFALARNASFIDSIWALTGTGTINGFFCSGKTEGTSSQSCYDLPTFNLHHTLLAGRTSSKYTEYVNGVANTLNPTLSFPANIVCPGATADSTCIGFTGLMSGVAFNQNPADWHNFSLVSSSSFHNAASDGKDLGADLSLIDTAQRLDQYLCATACGTGPYADGDKTSTVSALQNSNGSGCTANGSPDAGCNAAFTGLSTDAGNNNAQTQLLAPAPANMSTVATRSMLYSGATSKVRAYYQPFFRCGSHIDIGMDESDSTAIAKQAAAMVAMGIDIVNIDHYGTSLTCEKAISDGWATYLAANPTVPLKLEIMLDQGAIKPFCTATLTTWNSGTAYTVGQGVTFGTHAYVALNSSTNKQPDTNPSNWQVMETCIINAMEAQLDDIDTSYGSKSFYSKDSSGRPFLFCFITPATWANTDFSGTIYPALLTYAHTHYTGRVYQVLDRFGSFGANFDGEYAWIQPPLYVNASPTSQKCWDSISGGACNWTTGVGSGTSYLNTFYAACLANPTKHCIGMLSKGFDWTHASWMTSPKIVQQGCGNVPQLMAAKVAANGYSSASQLEGIGWVTWNDYEEETAMEMGIDNCARPTVSVSAPNQLGWLENPTDATYFSESGTIDHWEIWYTTTGGTTLTKALGGIAPSVSTEVISSVIPAGTWDVYLYMVGKSGIINRLAGPAAYTH